MPPARQGFTLLEVMVVLVILGLATSLVPTAWRWQDRGSSDGSWTAVVTTARRLALDRGEALELRIGAGGQWGILVAASGDTVRTGQLADGEAGGRGADRVHLDVLGLCHPIGPASVGTSAFDMASCRATDAADLAR